MIYSSIILAVIAFLAVAVGVVVWLRNTEHETYKSFLALCVAGALWIITNLLFVQLSGGPQYAVALVSYGTVGLFATSFIVFSHHLARGHLNIRPFTYAGVILSIVAMLPGVLAQGVEENRIITTPLLVVYALWLITYYAVGIYTLVAGLAHTSSIRRRQIVTVLYGIIFTFLGAGVCNLLLPLLGNYDYIMLGPAFSVIFLIFFAYTIVYHQLFDIKRALARLIVYGSTVAVIGAGLGYAVYLLTAQTNTTQVQPLLMVGLGLSVAALFPLVKHGFDQLTRNLLYVGEYDIQEAINKMTAIFSSSRSVDHLVRSSTEMLRTILGASKVEIQLHLDEAIEQVIRKNKYRLLIRDEVSDSVATEVAYEVMQKSNTALYAPLQVGKNTIGYLELADKTYGTSYSMHDKEFIRIISSELAIALQNAERFQEIQHFNDQLQSRIREATKELRKTNTKLRQIDASKDEFISMASHQLRTPLTSIKGYISMLLDGDLGALKPAQRRALEEAYDSSQRMVYLIGDFLNLSRIQTGRFELELENVSLPTILAEEIDQLRQSAEKRDISLLYTAPQNFPLVQADETKIRQVMMNFIDNAIYYAKPTGGEILVVLEQQRDCVVFSVKDNGIGVPASVRSHLFTKFYRAENAKKARPDGTGIGLYMSKRVVQAHGGEIIFSSKENEGSEFGFRLPTA